MNEGPDGMSGSASCCLGLAEGEASLVRSACLDARPLALPAPSVSPIFRTYKAGSFFFLQFFSSQFELVD